MKTFVSLAVAAALSFSFVSIVHADAEKPGHTHAPTITEANAQEVATAELKALIEKKKLTADWANAPVKTVEQVGSAKDWVVQFENAQAKDEKKKNLYVILSTSGKVKAVNYVGAQRAHSHGNGPAHTH